MRFLIFFCLLLALPAHADAARDAFNAADHHQWADAAAKAKSGEPALQKTIAWLYMQDADSGATFQQITHFIEQNPDWPHQDRLHLRAEQSLKSSSVPDAALKSWFEKNPPISGLGKLKLAELRLREGAKRSDEAIRTLIREAWRDGDFEEAQEKRIPAEYSEILRPEDHFARADRLLWEDRTQTALRMLPLLPAAQQPLVRARAALISGKSEAAFLLLHLPPAALRDPGLVYARLEWRVAHGDTDGIRTTLLAAPDNVPYPEKWWKARELAVRQDIADGRYGEAHRLLLHHGLTEGQDFAEAVWLSGWLSLEYLNDPQSAYLQFYHMADAVTHPVSKARAAYWAARAAEKTGDTEAAHGWYVKAASYPTTFYGQAANLHLNGTLPLRLPAGPKPDGAANAEIARAAEIAGAAGALDTASTLIYHLIDIAKTPAQAAAAAEIGTKTHSEVLSVRAAKRVMQQHDALLLSLGYPRFTAPNDLPVEAPLALAVTRQESEFDLHAKSPAGALGLMQIAGATAREVARKIGLPFAPSRLYERDYNVRVSSAYLARLVKAYDGSYVLAIAAYNAGPGNVRNWLSRLGTPPRDLPGVLDWIERIPYGETRNYIQRVVENLEVYRQITGGENIKLMLAGDLSRGK